MNGEGFWEFFEEFNSKIKLYLDDDRYRSLTLQAEIEIHTAQLKEITELYTE
jgi:hypothetical protein